MLKKISGLFFTLFFIVSGLLVRHILLDNDEPKTEKKDIKNKREQKEITITEELNKNGIRYVVTKKEIMKDSLSEIENKNFVFLAIYLQIKNSKDKNFLVNEEDILLKINSNDYHVNSNISNKLDKDFKDIYKEIEPNELKSFILVYKIKKEDVLSEMQLHISQNMNKNNFDVIKL